LQSRAVHPVLGTASLHASIIHGGREWSSYPDKCELRVERRTIAGETAASADAEIRALLVDLKEADPEFAATSSLVFSRSAYETPAGHPLPAALASIAAGGYELLDRCGGSRGGGNPLGAVRPGRSRPSQHRGVRDGRRCARVSRCSGRSSAQCSVLSAECGVRSAPGTLALWHLGTVSSALAQHQPRCIERVALRVPVEALARTSP
jgi:hypothetical protein